MPSSLIVGGKYSIPFLTYEISAPADHMEPRMRVTEGFYFVFFLSLSKPFRVDSPGIIMQMFALSFKNKVHIATNSIYPK